MNTDVRQQLDQLLEALRPFAMLGGPDDGIMPAFQDMEDDEVVYKNSGRSITAGDVRAARKLVSKYVQPADLSASAEAPGREATNSSPAVLTERQLGSETHAGLQPGLANEGSIPSGAAIPRPKYCGNSNEDCECLGCGQKLSLLQQGLRKCPADSAAPKSPSGAGWLIYFDDNARQPEIFTGEGAETSAKQRFEELRANWSVRLFSTAPASGSDLERAAKVCEDMATQFPSYQGIHGVLREAAAAIRQLQEG